jgi:autotransporter-associated beta strand protein
LGGNWTNFTGILEVNGSAASSALRLIANGGTFNGDLSNALVRLSASANQVSLVGRFFTNGTMSIGALEGSSSTTIKTATGSGAGTFIIGNLNTDTTFAGTISNGAAALGIRKVGTGTLTLSGTANDHTGTTVINGGTLKYNGVKTGAGATTVNIDATLTGTGTLAGTTTVASGGILAPGDAGSGNLTFANLTLSGGSIVKLGASPAANKAVVQTGGTLSVASGVIVDVNGFGTDGTYDIMDITGATLNGSAATAFSATNTVGGKVYTFSSTATSIRLTIAGSDPSNYWNVDGSGSWALGPNWTKNPVIPNAPEAIAKVGPGAAGTNVSFSGNVTIALDDNKTIGVLALDDDFGSVITIDPGTPAGSLTMDNGTSPASVVVVTGEHIINAPLVINALGTGVDLAAPHTLTLNGEISGIAGVLSKTGTGTLTLAGTNVHGGGTVLGGGVTKISSDAALGNTSGALRFAGGTLTLNTDITGVTRSYLVVGSNNASIDTSGFNLGYDGVISPLSGGTGGLSKTGLGTLTLSGVQTYTGVTTLNGGGLVLSGSGSITGSAVNLNAGTFTVAGGTLTASATSNVVGSGFTLSGGSATFAGLNGNTGNPSSNIFLNLTGGTFSASSLAMGRCSTAILTLTEGTTTSGLYVAGSTASISGTLSIGQNNTGTNSTASARIDSGSLTVGGAISISIASPDRWSVLDVNGGTFTSTNVATGIQVGVGQTGNVAFLVRGGQATAERILLQQPAASLRTSRLQVSGGALYVGSGGIVGNNNAGAGVIDVQFGTATLGAKAAWSSAVAASLTGTTTIKAADVSDSSFDITLSGVLSGTGGFDKTGAGILTLSGASTFSGPVAVNAGTLNITGDNSAATGAVNVLSGATLAGSGNIGGNVTIQSGGRQAIAVAASAGSQPLRTISGSLTLSGGDVIDLTAAAPPAAGTYTLVTATGGITGTLPTSTINYNGFTGTLAIDGNSLKLTVSGSGYSSWASTNGLTAGVNDGANNDPDNDGIENQLEFVLGGNPLAASSNILPQLDASGPNFVFTFKREDESEAEIALTFQHGSDLTEWTNVPVGAASSLPQVGVTENAAAPDDITITIPKGSNTSLFGRLRGVK